MNSKCWTKQHCNWFFFNFLQFMPTNWTFSTTSNLSVPMPWPVAQPWSDVTLIIQVFRDIKLCCWVSGEWPRRQLSPSNTRYHSPTTHYHIPEDYNSQKYRCGNLKSRNFITHLSWRMGLTLAASSFTWLYSTEVCITTKVLSGTSQNNFLSWISLYMWKLPKDSD